MKTREITFPCADQDRDMLNVSFDGEPGMIYVEVDHAESFLSGVWLDVQQVMELRDELSEWLEQNS